MILRDKIRLIIKLVLIVVPFLIIWNPVVDFTFYFAQGDESTYNIGDGYKISGWPTRYLKIWDPNENTDVVISDSIEESAVVDPWLIGRTPMGWLAVNKKTHEIFYPYASKEALSAAIKFDLSSVITSASPPAKYKVIRPWTRKSVLTAHIFLGSLLTVLLVVFVVIPLVFRKNKQIEQSKQIDVAKKPWQYQMLKYCIKGGSIGALLAIVWFFAFLFLRYVFESSKLESIIVYFNIVIIYPGNKLVDMIFSVLPDADNAFIIFPYIFGSYAISGFIFGFIIMLVRYCLNNRHLLFKKSDLENP